MELSGQVPSPTLPTTGSAHKARQRATIWGVLLAVLMIPIGVVICSQLGAMGLVPEQVDESGRSMLFADYRPWEIGSAPFELDIPRLATAAAREEAIWNTGDFPTPTPTPTDVPAVIPSATSRPTDVRTDFPTATATVYFIRPTTSVPAPLPTDLPPPLPTDTSPPPTPDGGGSDGGGSDGGGSDGGGTDGGGTQDVPTPVPPTPEPPTPEPPTPEPPTPEPPTPVPPTPPGCVGGCRPPTRTPRP